MSNPFALSGKALRLTPDNLPPCITLSARDIWATIDEPAIRFVWVQGAPGSGKSKLAKMLAQGQASEGHSVALMYPTRDDAQVEHMSLRRDDSNLRVVAANRVSEYMSHPCRTFFADDADRFDATQAEGSPLLLASKRTDAFREGKVIAFSVEAMPEWMMSYSHRQFVLPSTKAD